MFDLKRKSQHPYVQGAQIVVASCSPFVAQRRLRGTSTAGAVTVGNPVWYWGGQSLFPKHQVQLNFLCSSQALAGAGHGASQSAFQIYFFFFANFHHFWLLGEENPEADNSLITNRWIIKLWHFARFLAMRNPAWERQQALRSFGGCCCSS